MTFDDSTSTPEFRYDFNSFNFQHLLSTDPAALMMTDQTMHSQYEITLTGTVDTQTDSTSFLVTINNPCADPAISGISESTTLDPFTYYIGGDESIYSSWMNYFTSNIPACGSVSFYPLKDVNNVQIDDVSDPLQSIAVFTETSGLLIQTGDFAMEGEHIVKGKAWLTLYPTI